jgi:hypothetical protein
VHLFARLVLVKLFFVLQKLPIPLFNVNYVDFRDIFLSEWAARSPTAESESDMDEFDSILNLEDEWEQEGRREGAEKGRQAGFSPVSSARDNVG